MSGDLIASLIASQHIEEMQDTKSKWIIAYVFFLWTTIFMVKFCYFAFFYTLIRSMPRGFIWFYWSSVVFTVIAWIFLVLQQLIPCPYFGSDAGNVSTTHHLLIRVLMQAFHQLINAILYFRSLKLS